MTVSLRESHQRAIGPARIYSTEIFRRQESQFNQVFQALPEELDESLKNAARFHNEALGLLESGSLSETTKLGITSQQLALENTLRRDWTYIEPSDTLKRVEPDAPETAYPDAVPYLLTLSRFVSSRTYDEQNIVIITQVRSYFDPVRNRPFAVHVDGYHKGEPVPTIVMLFLPKKFDSKDIAYTYLAHNAIIKEEVVFDREGKNGKKAFTVPFTSENGQKVLDTYHRMGETDVNGTQYQVFACNAAHSIPQSPATD